MDQADDFIPSWKLKPSSSVSHFCFNFQHTYGEKKSKSSGTLALVKNNFVKFVVRLKIILAFG